MTDLQFYSLLAVSVLALIVALAAFLRKPRRNDPQLQQLRREMLEELRATRTELGSSINSSLQNYSSVQSTALKQIAGVQDSRLQGLDERFKALSLQTELKLDSIRRTMETRLAALQEDNNHKLDQMRETVDEKLQKTLEDKLAKSFGLVNERLEQVYKGLGEMQTLAIGVGDLKKVLSNVKTRGILGEIQLGAILQEILTPDQYDENVATRKGSSERVEFAVKLPSGEDGETIYLPIDAKFPADCYANLMEAYDTGDTEQIAAAGKVLENRIRSEAKDIRDKYVHVPDTTEFGILFLPVEGLYAEVVRRGMVERLQTEYKVTIAGPTIMAALLNSLQMGFHTLAIQKRSSEVWDILGNVKSEFETFGKALAQTQNRLHQASDELENLVGVRTRQIQRRLRTITSLPAAEVPALPETPLQEEIEE
ncbi:MAG: recombination protein RmuC [Clostridiales bacterium]|nr:recombination protein RmuC [Clostridiales bacterium]